MKYYQIAAAALALALNAPDSLIEKVETNRKEVQ